MRKTKVLACIAVLLLSSMGSSALFACGYYGFPPQEYYVYRITDQYLKKVEVDPAYLPGSDENCQLWMQQLGAETIGKDEVFEIVYKAELDSLASLSEYNAFATILSRNPEALKVLRLAKDCEKARFAVTGDPWYYPVKGDSVRTALEEIVSRARAYDGGIFQSRYFLQEIRALFTLGRYEEIISRWAAVEASLPDDILKELTIRYVAGAKFNIGEVDEAVSIFLSVGDLTSAISCKNLENTHELEAIIEIDPNYPGIRGLLEQEIRSLCLDDVVNSEYQVERLDEIRALCDHVLSMNPDDKAVWYYTAAYIDYYKGRYSAAKASLKKARKVLQDDTVLDGSVRVLAMLTDARSSRHNIFYEWRLLRDLKWLDGQIVGNLTDEISERTANGYGWEIRSNYSYYYWNDMMRLLTVGILVPEYIKEGKYTRALGLANMASNRLLNLTGVSEYVYNGFGNSSFKHFSISERRKQENEWKQDYSNDFFSTADSLGATRVMRYVAHTLKPRTALERFTAERSNNDPDYLNDLVGTLLIRERRYAEAVKYLEKLPEGFQKRLNTHCYLEELSDEAKLDHARRMVELAAKMKDKSDLSAAAEAKWEYGQGMMRQYRNDWALSYYFQTAYPPEYIQRSDEEGTGIASKLITEAMAAMPDPEEAARMYFAMCNYETVAVNYPDTEAAGWVRAWCDTWADYHREYPANWE